MEAIELLKLMGEMGLHYKPLDLQETINYTSSMIDDERVIVIYENFFPCAVLFFSVTDTPKIYLKKGIWEYRPHNSHGKMVYIEKLVSTKWNRHMRGRIETELLTLYPKLERGVWHRDSKFGDRKVYTPRRVKENV